MPAPPQGSGGSLRTGACVGEALTLPSLLVSVLLEASAIGERKKQVIVDYWSGVGAGRGCSEGRWMEEPGLPALLL